MKLNMKQNKAAETDVCFLSLRSQGMPGRLGWDLRMTMTQVRTKWTQCKNELGGSRMGRLVLHALCMVQHPDRANWHWQGMLREFAP